MAALISCSQSSPPRSEFSGPTDTPVVLSLSSRVPSASVDLSLTGAQLKVSVNRIDDPSGQAVGIHVVLGTCPTQGTATTYDLGLVTPYPITQTGVYVLQIPTEATAKLKSCGGAASIDLTLVPIRDQEALSGGTTISATLLTG